MAISYLCLGKLHQVGLPECVKMFMLTALSQSARTDCSTHQSIRGHQRLISFALPTSLDWLPCCLVCITRQRFSSHPHRARFRSRLKPWARCGAPALLSLPGHHRAETTAPALALGKPRARQTQGFQPLLLLSATRVQIQKQLENPPAPLQVNIHVSFVLCCFPFFFFPPLSHIKDRTVSKNAVFSSWFGHDIVGSTVCPRPARWVFGPALFPYMACSSARHSILHIPLSTPPTTPLLFKSHFF